MNDNLIAAYILHSIDYLTYTRSIMIGHAVKNACAHTTLMSDLMLTV